MKKKRIITFALAAALILAMGAVAYAADLFGIRALFMSNSAPADNPNGGYVSFTQPQDVPEEMDAGIRAKIDNSTKAWAEWTAWSRENGIYERMDILDDINDMGYNVNNKSREGLLYHRENQVVARDIIILRKK